MFGHRYFLCQPNHGLFVRPSAVRVVEKAVDAFLPTAPGEGKVDPGPDEARGAQAAPQKGSRRGPAEEESAGGILKPSAHHVVEHAPTVREKIIDIERRMLRTMAEDMQIINPSGEGVCPPSLLPRCPSSR